MAQLPKFDPRLSRTNREAYADALEEAHRELHNSKLALQENDTDEARARYAKAL